MKRILGLVPVVLVLMASLALVATALADLGAIRRLPWEFSGTPVLVDSKAGRFVVSGQRMLPGQTVRGEVRLANRGTRPGVLFVRLRRPADTPGRRGAELSGKLLLTIRRVGRHGGLRTVWKGYVRSMPRVRLGVLRPGAARRYRFVVRFRAHPPARGRLDDDDYQGSRFTTDFVWELVALR